jgi:hypothetical protein
MTPPSPRPAAMSEARHPPFAINVVDSAMINATPLAAQWLDMIGQGGERAYRRALLSIFDAHRNAPKAWVAGLVDSVVVSLSFVSMAAPMHAAFGPEKGADLASFFIQRAKHMTPALSPTQED